MSDSEAFRDAFVAAADAMFPQPFKPADHTHLAQPLRDAGWTDIVGPWLDQDWLNGCLVMRIEAVAPDGERYAARVAAYERRPCVAEAELANAIAVVIAKTISDGVGMPRKKP